MIKRNNRRKIIQDTQPIFYILQLTFPCICQSEVLLYFFREKKTGKDHKFVVDILGELQRTEEKQNWKIKKIYLPNNRFVLERGN